MFPIWQLNDGPIKRHIETIIIHIVTYTRIYT